MSDPIRALLRRLFPNHRVPEREERVRPPAPAPTGHGIRVGHYRGIQTITVDVPGIYDPSCDRVIEFRAKRYEGDEEKLIERYLDFVIHSRTV